MRLFGYYSRHWPTVLFLGLVLGFHLWGLLQPSWRRRYGTLIAVHAAVVTFAVACTVHPLLRALEPRVVLEWFRGLGMLSGLTAVAIIAIATVFLFTRGNSQRPLAPDRGRRQFLRAAQGAVISAPAAVAAFAVISRNQQRVTERDLRIPALHPDLDGLRIVQLSDIHMSTFVSVRDVERVVDIANEFRPQLALVTGDQITGPRDPLEVCLRELARLKADAGVWGCLGNHELFARCEEQTERIGAHLGIRFLRQANAVLRFGNATLNLAGVDHQPFNRPYLVGAERLKVPGAFNLLMSHNPDVFPVAADKGFDLTLAGHTHGGQVTVEILHQWANAARFFTPYVYGEYRKDHSVLYVTRGIGTVGIPARVGAPPEIAVLRLCAS